MDDDGTRRSAIRQVVNLLSTLYAEKENLNNQKDRMKGKR